MGVVLVAAVFGAVTIGTMLAVVMTMRAGLIRLSFAAFERYTHAFADATILLCGLAIQFLGQQLRRALTPVILSPDVFCRGEGPQPRDFMAWFQLGQR